MPTYFYVVLTRAEPGREDEFHDWYDAQHLPDCVNVPGVTSAKRYKLLYGVGAGSVVEEAPYHSLAIYELETDDPMAVARELSARAGTDAMPISDALSREAAVKYVAVGPSDD